MDGGAWWAAVHGVAEGGTRLSDFTFMFHFHALEKETATNSSVLAWRIPGMGKPGGLPSVGSHRVGHNWSDLAVAVGRGRRYNLGEWHWNMYVIICETNRQSRLYACYRLLGAGTLGWPRGMVWGMRWERGSGWGTRVHPWWIHVYVWQTNSIF